MDISVYTGEVCFRDQLAQRQREQILNSVRNGDASGAATPVSSNSEMTGAVAGTSSATEGGR
jgi:hypothetical protein